MRLNDKQFKNYQPAAEEGRAESDWLSTDEGHTWQTQMHSKVRYQDFNPDNTGLFSIKKNVKDNSDFWEHSKHVMHWVPGYDG